MGPSRTQVLKAAAATVPVTVGVASFGVLLAMVLAGRSAAGLAQPIDDAARTWIEAGTSRTDPFASILDVVCGAGAMTLWAALGGLVMWWRTRRPLLAVAPFVIALAADSVVLAVKQIVARPRPAVMAGALGDRYSFPSGHATVAAAAAAAVALQWFGPARRAVVLVAAGVFVALVAASRLVLGVHWLSDVVVGAALGTLLAVSLAGVGRGSLESERLARAPEKRTR